MLAPGETSNANVPSSADPLSRLKSVERQIRTCQPGRGAWNRRDADVVVSSNMTPRQGVPVLIIAAVSLAGCST
jgi:hypothetical protein